MTEEQLAMTEMLEELFKDYHRQRAVRPSEIVPCDECPRTAWIAVGEPHLCWRCYDNRPLGEKEG